MACCATRGWAIWLQRRACGSILSAIRLRGATAAGRTLRHFRRQLARLLDQIELVTQIAETEFRQTALLLTEQLARPAQFQVRLRDAKTVVRFFQHLQSFIRRSEE